MVALESQVDQLGVDLMEKEGQHTAALAVIDEMKEKLSERDAELEAAYGDLDEKNAVIEDRARAPCRQGCRDRGDGQGHGRAAGHAG